MAYSISRRLTIVGRVEIQERAAKYTEAVLAQLNAEISAAGTDVKSLAGRLQMDYNTFRRYTIGERPMPMTVLWSALEALGVDEVVFIDRAKARNEGR